VQSSEGPSPLPEDSVTSTFADRAKAARLRAGLTQQQLFRRLQVEAGISLDTSAITRIENGQREPRLGEALAIARVLNFGLNNLVPRADLDFYLSDVERLMRESRAALVRMVKSVDPLLEFVRAHPDCLGHDRLDDRFRKIIEYFQENTEHDDLKNVAITTNRTDEKLKRQLLRAVGEGVLVRTEDIQPAYEGWYQDDVGAERRSTSGVPQAGWQRGERRVRIERWEKSYAQLLDYVRRHSNARVPSTHVSEDGERLGAWVVQQRDLFARGMLDAERSKRLEQLPGWTWGSRAGKP
jgi:transcriptional regulator with XRE-family HTH domain